MLGTFHRTVHFQLLTGLHLGHQEVAYWQIFIPLMLLIPTLAISCIIFKRIKEMYKDRKILQQININLKTQEPKLSDIGNDYSILHEPEIAMAAKIAFSTLNLNLKPRNPKWKKLINNHQHNPGKDQNTELKTKEN